MASPTTHKQAEAGSLTIYDMLINDIYQWIHIWTVNFSGNSQAVKKLSLALNGKFWRLQSRIKS